MCNACDARFMQFMRSHRNRRGFVALAGATAAAGLPLSTFARSGAGQPAEQIFLAKTIHTVDRRNTAVQALAVRQGRSVALGSRKDVLGLKGPRTKIVDFDDRVVLPGFVAPHMHSNFCSLRTWLDGERRFAA